MMMGLTRQNMPNAHGPYDLRRFFIAYITWKNLLLLGAIILIEVHLTRYFNTPGGLVVVSIGMGFVRTTNKNTLNSSRYEFTKLFFLVLDEALATKDTEI
jgi:hypothetical protein